MAGVVLFVGHDGELGETFYCENEGQVEKAVKILLERADYVPEEFIKEAMEALENTLKYEIEGGIIYYGGLETLGD